jgi:hypothetical protein
MAGNQSELCFRLASDACPARLRILKLLRFMPSLRVFWNALKAPDIS